MSYVTVSNKRNYGKLLAKQAETRPWDTLCIDLIGKYRMTPNNGSRKYAMKGKKDKDVYLQAICPMLKIGRRKANTRHLSLCWGWLVLVFCTI